MDKRTAQRLAETIEHDDPRVRVTGMRRYPGRSYALDCVDIRTGDRFVVNRPEDWTERSREALCYTHTQG